MKPYRLYSVRGRTFLPRRRYKYYDTAFKQALLLAWHPYEWLQLIHEPSGKVHCTIRATKPS